MGKLRDGHDLGGYLGKEIACLGVGPTWLQTDFLELLPFLASLLDNVEGYLVLCSTIQHYGLQRIFFFCTSTRLGSTQRLGRLKRPSQSLVLATMAALTCD
jgi:hypothetical protein